MLQPLGRTSLPVFRLPARSLPIWRFNNRDRSAKAVPDAG